MAQCSAYASQQGCEPCSWARQLRRIDRMRVFIANFGVANSLWPICLARPSIATFEDEDLYAIRVSNDRERYIAHAMATKTTKGISPPKQLASRWFNLSAIVAATEGDLWIHREKDVLWWTISAPGPVQTTLEQSFLPRRPGDRIYVIQKPASAWSDRSKRGALLDWRSLHPKACHFLFTEGTLQQLGEDNARYAIALVEGNDLSAWHALPGWKAKEQAARRGAVRELDAREAAIVRMVRTVEDTVAQCNGQPELRIVKNKEMRFKSPALRQYIATLIEVQEGLCALTGVPLQFDGAHDDPECLCSLDRINSDGHYEQENLQVVCRFANRWKSNGDDTEFRRLIGLVRDVSLVE